MITLQLQVFRCNRRWHQVRPIQFPAKTQQKQDLRREARGQSARDKRQVQGYKEASTSDECIESSEKLGMQVRLESLGMIRDQPPDGE